MFLFAKNLEIRGIQHKKSDKGNFFYIIHVEEESGEAFKLYARDDSGFEPNLKKGDLVDCLFDYNDKFKSLILLEMHRIKNKVEK